MSILQEIQQWKLDAKFEESSRYFFHTGEINKIESGEYCYVIGRKGCGKTAISQSIYNKKSHDIFTEKLTFKNFPFNSLYELNDNSYSKPNQYISIWKYLIYSSICRMMVRNENIDNEVRVQLEKIYGGTESISNLRRIIHKWVAKEWTINVFGFGGKVALTEENKNQSWMEKVDILEDIITNYIDDFTYYIVFDELDEDYSNVVTQGTQSNYINLITSLFKAIQDIKSVFQGSKNGIKPIIFLRDDIYELVQDSDKTKWNDFKIELDWNKESIQKLLAFRISKALNESGEILTFNDAWHKAFQNRPVKYGSRQQKLTDIFTYMTNSTQLRPRDFVRYIQACATEALINNRTSISPIVVRKVDKAFSNYLKDELIDEIHGILPDIKEVLSVISEIRKWIFSIEEFKQQYMKSVKNGALKNQNPDLALKILFHFSVIGNQPRQKQVSFFRYTNKEARFNFNEQIIVHRGLFKALQIM